MDAGDLFGQAFGLKAIPVSFLVDEVGIIRLKGGGPSRGFLSRVEAILQEPMTEVRGRVRPLESARTREALEARVSQDPEDWRGRLALAQVLNAGGEHDLALDHLTRAKALAPDTAEVHFTLGMVRLHLEQPARALEHLKRARDLDPDNWRIRKQIWALEHPDKFYEGRSPDYGWQKEQLERERER